MHYMDKGEQQVVGASLPQQVKGRRLTARHKGLYVVAYDEFRLRRQQQAAYENLMGRPAPACTDEQFSYRPRAKNAKAILAAARGH